MDKNRYKEISERNKNDRMMLCFEIFCEEGREKGYKQIPLQVFKQLFPQWIMTMQPDVFIRSGGDIEECTKDGLNKIINFLNKKHE